MSRPISSNALCKTLLINDQLCSQSVIKFDYKTSRNAKIEQKMDYRYEISKYYTSYKKDKKILSEMRPVQPEQQLAISKKVAMIESHLTKAELQMFEIINQIEQICLQRISEYENTIQTLLSTHQRQLQNVIPAHSSQVIEISKRLSDVANQLYSIISQAKQLTN